VESIQYVKRKGIDLNQLDDPSYSNVLERALRRIKEAIDRGEVHTYWPVFDDEVEVLSYPVAIALVAATGDPYLKRRYALSEAKRVYKLLNEEVEPLAQEKLAALSKDTFGWRVRPLAMDGTHYDFSIHLADYLKNSSSLRGDSWKLVNRIVIGGEVYVSRRELARLLQEEVRKRIERRLDERLKMRLPEGFSKFVYQVQSLLLEKRKGEPVEYRIENARLIPEAFPPCIKSLYELMKAKQHLPHIGRFTLATFLLSVGVSIEDLLILFKTSTDFDERKARYQIEHLAGERGSRRKYLPPSCQLLRTYGVCRPTSSLCNSVKNPIVYYKRMKRVLSK
jgi:DNA primase large subunit